MNFKRLAVSLGIFAALCVPHAVSAQLAGRPAKDWSPTLETDARISSMKIDEVVAKLGLKPGQSVADIGAGPGLFEVPLAKAVAPNGKVYAEDIDAGFFDEINQKASAGHVTNVVTVLGKFTDPALPVKRVDLVMFNDVFHHIEDRGGYLKAVANYLGPGGRVAIIDYIPGMGGHKDQPELQVSPEQFTTLANAAGLKQVQDVKMFPDKYFLIFQK
jgi:cyclopropane fatty-acyl-phospholipid synthase-like methyltransferase